MSTRRIFRLLARLGRDSQPPLVPLCTVAGNPSIQCLAYNLAGRSFTKFSGHPMLPRITTLALLSAHLSHR